MPDIHPLVERYLRHFDAASAAVPEPRRTALREEIADHLVELVPAGARDDDARLALLEFGGPEEIVGQEAAVEPRRSRRRLVLGGVASVIIAAVGVSAFLLCRPADTSYVTTYPDSFGPRITDGRAFEEYRAEIAKLPDLPPGASWPEGVPQGLDAGLVEGEESAYMEAGAGLYLAQSTFGCAWGIEYLEAEEAGDDRRLVAAFGAVEYWFGLEKWTNDDHAGEIVSSVLEPLRIEKSAGLRMWVVESCTQAGIRDVHSKLRDRGL